MKISRRILVRTIVILAMVILLLICLLQYNVIQRNRVLNLNAAFYYMQEMIEDETENSFENWENKAESLYRFEDLLPQTEGLGDFNEVKKLIHDVSQIRDPMDAEASLLIKKAKEMKITWNTKFGRWGVEII